MTIVANHVSENTNAALVISPDAEMIAELLPLLDQEMAGLEVHAIGTYPDSRTLLNAVREQAPTLCFLDMETDFERAEQLVADLSGGDSPVTVIALLGRCDSDRILRCLRRGAVEFLTRPFNSKDLEPVLDRLCKTGSKETRADGARVICVAPVKGACGASTIATNLAYQRKALGAKKMLLADLDPLTGIVAFLLKVKSNYSFMDALNRAATGLDADLWKGIVSSKGELDILPGPENPLESVQDLENPTVLIEFARQFYDTIIIDCAGVVGDWGLAIAAACDELLLVTTNELPALQATQRVLAYLERNRVERAKIRLLVNRFSKDVGLSREAIMTALHSDIFHLLPSDYEAVHRALMEGKPIPSGTAFGKSLVSLATKLSGQTPGDVENPEKPDKPKSSLVGMMTSIFSRKKK